MTCNANGRFMSERRIAQLIGLILGGLLTCTMVLNALALA
jgi:hypothetical protein